MKSKLISTVLILLLGMMGSCDYEVIRPEGEVTSREANFSGYSALQVSDAFNVNVQFSDTEEKITIKANENLHDRIIVKMEGQTLRIGLKNYTNIKGSATLDAFIVTNRITNFDVSGASKLSLESELIASEADIKLSGASEFKGALDLDRLELEAGGASHLNIFGNTAMLNASLSGASTLEDYDFTIGKLNLRMAGASDTYLSVDQSIDIEASGASKLSYKGNAEVREKRLSGASEIIKK